MSSESHNAEKAVADLLIEAVDTGNAEERLRTGDSCSTGTRSASGMYVAS